jgi:glycosyltransferase involved in cell wall biosynthesis
LKKSNPLNEELISVIVPAYNSKMHIEESLNSVKEQFYQNWEMIIVDDCSTDNTVEVVEKYIKNDRRIRLIKLEKNSGPALARNRAIKEAQGRYIAFLDADDLWLPEKLNKQIMFMNKHNLSFTYSSYYLMNEEGHTTGTFTIRETINYQNMLKTSSVGCLTAIYDTKILGKQYMPSILKRQDYGLWLQILKDINSTKGIIEPLATYRILHNSVSSNKLMAAKYQWEIYRDVEKLNLWKSIYYFIHYTFHGIIKYRV